MSPSEHLAFGTPLMPGIGMRQDMEHLKGAESSLVWLWL